ncbi:hypothetical protein [Lewinella sp. W8]|uniref:hypothetical protein n=1 Tax=Lewinella sp. W8 TaxID=2528208 RepID=UPI0010676DE2|nr:hypothetical protein [Lewinella sp. W8]MTB51324.1 hypothetical protein [Lewinella sp. W8]
MRKLIILTLCLAGAFLRAQASCPCCTEDHGGFDFWVGEWTVTDTTGTVLGANTIERVEGGCIVLEHWRGAQGSTGRSLNYYNRTTDTWHQTWVDNAGNPLILYGAVQNGSMVMRTDEQTAQSGTVYYNRVTWTPLEDGSVRQQWDIMSTTDSLLSTVFLGIYRKEE